MVDREQSLAVGARRTSEPRVEDIRTGDFLRLFRASAELGRQLSDDGISVVVHRHSRYLEPERKLRVGVGLVKAGQWVVVPGVIAFGHERELAKAGDFSRLLDRARRALLAEHLGVLNRKLAVLCHDHDIERRQQPLQKQIGKYCAYKHR